MEDETIFETCPYCDRTVGVVWNVNEDGYKMYCNYCGKEMMLCSMCEHINDCDWNEETGCKMSRNEGR